MKRALPTCLRVAVAADPGARRPFFVDGRQVGSVANAHLAALRAWPQGFDVDEHQGVVLTIAQRGRDRALASVHHRLREAGLLRGWRDETFPLLDPATLQVLARIERAASRFWGALTFGAHATGYVADAGDRPSHLWIARRAANKATDPGRFDNLIGGGVPDGQTPTQALVREGFEEAGLRPEELARARCAGVLRLLRDVPEGLQHEWLHSFDVELPAGRVPLNQDGEVAGFTLMPVAEALELAWGEGMTVDAALVTIDFAVRHRFIDEAIISDALKPLRVVLPG